MNVTEVRDSDFKNVFPGIFNFTIWILNKTDFQTYFSPIPDLLADSFDCEHVQSSDGMESGMIRTDLYTAAEYGGEIILEVTKVYLVDENFFSRKSWAYLIERRIDLE